MTNHLRKGFTLMELLVASVLTVLVFSAVYTTFSSTIRIWRLGQEGLTAYQDARLTLTLMARDLNAVVPGTWDLAAGNKSEMSWFAIRTPMYPKKNAEPRLMKISYFTRPDGKGNYKIMREEQPVVDFLPLKSQDASMQRDTKDVSLGRKTSVELCTGISKLRLQYFWTVVPEKPEPGSSSPEPPLLPPVEKEELVSEYGAPQVIRIIITITDPSSDSGKIDLDSWVVLPGSLPKIKST